MFSFSAKVHLQNLLEFLNTGRALQRSTTHPQVPDDDDENAPYSAESSSYWTSVLRTIQHLALNASLHHFRDRRKSKILQYRILSLIQRQTHGAIFLRVRPFHLHDASR